MKKYIIIIVLLLLAVLTITGWGTIKNQVLPWLNPLNWFEVVHDFFSKEHTLDLQLYGNYKIDTSGIKDYERKIRKYAEITEDVPFVYFIQLPLEDSIMDAALEDLSLNLPDELSEDITSSNENEYVLFSFGRELKEIKYKTTSYYNHIKAEITFCEEHQDDTVYVYFMEDNIFFWETSYYVMEGAKKVHLGDNLFYTY